jgi:hypothetical protein
MKASDEQYGTERLRLRQLKRRQCCPLLAPGCPLPAALTIDANAAAEHVKVAQQIVLCRLYEGCRRGSRQSRVCGAGGPSVALVHRRADAAGLKVHQHARCGPRHGAGLHVVRERRPIVAHERARCDCCTAGQRPRAAWFDGAPAATATLQRALHAPGSVSGVRSRVSGAAPLPAANKTSANVA